MIPNFFIYLFTLFIEKMASFLPVANALDSGSQQWVDTFRNGLSVIGWILPMDTIMVLVSAVLVIDAFVVAFVVFNFLYNKLRGSG